MAARPQTWAPPDPPPPPTAQQEPSPWDVWRKPRSILIFYGLKDGTAWVIVRHGDEHAVLAPWPVADDGWDESMPPSVGAADLTLGDYVLSNEPRAMVFLGRQADAVRTFGAYAELVAFNWPS